jgi:hypothetical protein
LFIVISSFYFLLKCRDQNSSSPVQDEADPFLQQLPSAKIENHAPSAVEISSIAPTESDECRDDSATSEVPQSTAICTTPCYMTYGLAPQSHGDLTLDTAKILLQLHIGFHLMGKMF